MWGSVQHIPPNLKPPCPAGDSYLTDTAGSSHPEEVWDFLCLGEMGYRAPILLVICACLSQHPPNLCLIHGEQIFPSSEGRRGTTGRTLPSGSEFLLLSSGCTKNTLISNLQPNVRNSLHQRRQRIWSPLIHQLVLARGRCD